MKAVIGVDLAGHSRIAVDLLRRLRFPALESVFVNTVESVLPDGSFVDLPSSHPITQMLKENEAEGRKLGAEAAEALGTVGEIFVVRGEPKAVLLKACDDQRADLVAVGSKQKSVWGDLFFGSVAKAMLAGAKCSVLFGKNSIEGDGPLNVVFATDHSEYANRAAEWLLSKGPAGIGKLVVLTAATINPLVGKEVVQHVENVGASITESIMEGIRKKNDEIAQRFREAGIDAVAEVREGHPANAIKDAMADHKADLLCVGAQGRGFLERLRIGSNSFDQVVNTPFNVLVIRP